MGDHDDDVSIPGQGTLLSVVLNNILEAQRQLLSTVATKHDMSEVREAFGLVTANHEIRISDLEKNKLPKWFWPTLGTLAVIVGSVSSAVELFLTRAHMAQDAAISTNTAQALTHAATVLRISGHH
jgi:hypothetical protein